MARTPLQKQRRINDRAIRAAAGVKCRRKSTNVFIAVVIIAVCAFAFLTLNEHILNIEKLPSWSWIFGNRSHMVNVAVTDLRLPYLK